MKIYLVGGAIRDKLLGLPVKERDWVVVGATVDDMLKLGFKQVGKEFPVFLHPKTNDEYALARLERKVQPGYTGFQFDASPKVTLEEDLLRRDLTINAMAESETGELIDPYRGKADLEKKILRHVSPAFAEDPVRILRVGRFLARYANLGFQVAPETTRLMSEMVQSGEVNALVAERVWKELERALGEKNPEKFFQVLASCGALAILFPGLEIDSTGMHALTAATNISNDASVRFAALLHHLPAENAIGNICNRYRVPNAFSSLAKLVMVNFAIAAKGKSLTSEELLKLFNALDIYRRADRFKLFLLACMAIAQIHEMSFSADWLAACAEAAKSVDVQALIKAGFSGSDLAEQIQMQRLMKISAWLDENR